MASTLFQVEYKKLNTFIYDFFKSISRNWIFIRTHAVPSIGDMIDFSFSVESLSVPLNFTGEVIYVGNDESGTSGIGIKIMKKSGNIDVIRNELIVIVEEKYGKYICSEFKRLIDSF